MLLKGPCRVSVSAVWELVEGLLAGLWHQVSVIMELLSADSAGEFKIFLRHGHSLSVDGAQLSIFEETGKVAL